MKKLWIMISLCLCLLLSGCDRVAAPEATDGSETTAAVQEQETSAAIQDQTEAQTQEQTEATQLQTEQSAQAQTQPQPVQGECTNHVDEQNDGRCDVCDTIVVVSVDFYSINDLHGKLADGENHPGVDELTTYLKREKSYNDNVVLLSAGDMWQGASESNLTRGQIITDWMNALDFESMTLGNHEYDWGETPIEENYSQAEFPFLAINVYERATNTQVDYCQSSLVVERGGIQIGIIGAMGDCYSSIASDKVADIYFKTGNELTRLVKEESQRLRSQGVDYIVYVIHDGYEESTGSSVTSVHSGQLSYYYDTELSDGYVDLVFEGHTHQKYILKDEYGVYHLQNGGDNKGISHVEVSVNTANGNIKTRYAELVSTGTYANMEDDPIVEQLLQKYNAEIAVASNVLGTNFRQRSSSELCLQMAELYYQKGLELWGDEYDIVLGGGFFSIRSPYTLAAGDVTYGQLQSLFPFDNNLVLCAVKGKDLKAKFFDTDNDRYYIAYGTYGEEVYRNLDPNGTYYIIVDSYTSIYGPNNLTEIARYEEELYARDFLADFIKQGGFAG